MPLINCKTNIILTWSDKCVLYKAKITFKSTTFAITYTKFHVTLVTLSAQDNGELLQQLKSRLERTINWRKYQLKVKIQVSNPYLDYWTVRTKYHLIITVEIKDHNLMIDGQNVFQSTSKKRFKNKSSWQILVTRTFQGRPPSTSPGRPLKVLFDHPRDVLIQETSMRGWFGTSPGLSQDVP